MAMSDEHKEALARGRREARAIKQYLKALEARRPGRPTTPESIKSRLARVEAQIESETDPLKKVELHQKKLDLESQLAHAESSADMDELEARFIEHAKAYSERKGITWKAWREVGVPAAVLKKAGIPRTRG